MNIFISIEILIVYNKYIYSMMDDSIDKKFKDRLK